MLEWHAPLRHPFTILLVPDRSARVTGALLCCSRSVRSSRGGLPKCSEVKRVCAAVFAEAQRSDIAVLTVGYEYE